MNVGEETPCIVNRIIATGIINHPDVGLHTRDSTMNAIQALNKKMLDVVVDDDHRELHARRFMSVRSFRFR